MTKHSQQSARPAQPTSADRRWLFVNVGMAVALMLGGVAMLFWLGGQASSNDDQNGALVNQPAPDFSLPSLHGEPVRLSDFGGQVVLINNWATWCPPCIAEMPLLNAYYQAHHAEGFTMLAINSQEDAATVRRFVAANGFDFPVLLDSEGEVGRLYQVLGLPTSFIIDRTGTVRAVQIGEFSGQQLETLVTPLLRADAGM